MNSEERSIYIKYKYNKVFSYIWDVYAEFEIRVNYSPEEYEGLKTGECRFDYSSWETRLNISHKQMVRAIKELTENDKVIIQKLKGTKGNSSIYFLIRFEEVLKNFEEQKKEQNEEQKQEQKESHNHAVLEGEEEQNKEQKQEQKKVHTSKYNNLSIKSNIYNFVFNYWNEQQIITHRGLTDKIIKAMEKALKNFTVEEVKEGISNYKEILDSDYFYSYKFTLEAFLKQENGISSFIDGGINFENYKQYQNKLKKVAGGIENISNPWGSVES